MEWLQKASSFIDTIDKATNKSLKATDEDPPNDDIIEEQDEERRQETDDDNDEHDTHEDTTATKPNPSSVDDDIDVNTEDNGATVDDNIDASSASTNATVDDHSNDDNPKTTTTATDTQPASQSEPQPASSSSSAVDNESPATNASSTLIDDASQKHASKKQRHRKKKKSTSTTATADNTTSTSTVPAPLPAIAIPAMNTDYQQLKKQYEGMVALWNEERSNLKKAQQLLRSQKDTFTAQQQSFIDDHDQKMAQVRLDFEHQLSAKQTTFNALESNLLQVKQERNHTIEDGDALRAQIDALEAGKFTLLSEKSQLCMDKQQHMQSLRDEFELERLRWEKERDILTKNIERETLLETENVEYTNALARAQASLQQKELENARLKGELKWLKQDKADLGQSNELLKEQNESAQRQLESARLKWSELQKQMVELKSEHGEKLMAEQKKCVGLTQKLDLLETQLQHQQQKQQDKSLGVSQNVWEDKSTTLRIKELTHSLLEKQAELDACVSKKNQLNMKVSKMEEEMVEMAQTGNANGRNKKDGLGADVESGLLSKRSVFARTSDLSARGGGVVMRRKSFTSYQSIDSGLAVFDRIGLELTHVLRNKPWIRLLVVMYIIVLHLWCGMVLHFSMNHVEDDKH